MGFEKFDGEGHKIVPLKIKKQERRPKLTEEEKCCGNCSAIKFSGPKCASLARGSCIRSEQSLRIYVASKDVSCPLWTRRSSVKEMSERRTAEALQEVIRNLNGTMKGRSKF